MFLLLFGFFLSSFISSLPKSVYPILYLVIQFFMLLSVSSSFSSLYSFFMHYLLPLILVCSPNKVYMITRSTKFFVVALVWVSNIFKCRIYISICIYFSPIVLISNYIIYYFDFLLYDYLKEFLC